MNNINSKRKIIPVFGEEAQLVRMAEQADLAAMQRAKASAPAGTINPMAHYETAAEKALIWQVTELEEKYRVFYLIISVDFRSKKGLAVV